jgi:hypothetical protein
MNWTGCRFGAVDGLGCTLEQPSHATADRSRAHPTMGEGLSGWERAAAAQKTWH